MKVFVALFAVLIVVVLLWKIFCIEENWRARSALQSYEAELRDSGEKLDIASFIPPTVPDEQNFAMAPMLAPIWKATKEELSNKPKSPGSPLERLEKVNLNIDGKSTPGCGDCETGKPPVWTAWMSYLGAAEQQTSIDQGKAAHAVLDWISRWSPELEEFSVAVERPYARFPIDYRKGIAVEIPHIPYLVSFARVFSVRANAALAVGDSSSALRDLHTLDRIQSALGSEPLLISYLVRNMTIRVLLQDVWQGCIDYRWNSDQLDAIEAMLAPIDLIADHAAVLRGERALSNATYDNFRASRRSPASIMSAYFSWAGISNDLHASTLRPKNAIMCRNQLSREGWTQNFELPILDAPAHRVYPQKQREATRVSHEMKPTWYNVMAKLAASSINAAPIRTATAQTVVDEARIACAIERFRIQRRSIPIALDELVPDYLSALPRDVINGMPLRYSPRADKNFILYSVGWNEKDDGGIVARKTSRPSSRDSENGDWVWFSAAQ